MCSIYRLFFAGNVHAELYYLLVASASANNRVSVEAQIIVSVDTRIIECQLKHKNSAS